MIDLVHEGKLDEAEQAARTFLERYPGVHDGYDRLGMVYEARGEKAAADCYRKVIEFVRAHPDQYEPTFAVTFEQMVDELRGGPAYAEIRIDRATPVPLECQNEQQHG